MNNEKLIYMRAAIEEARIAYTMEEIPVGAVVVKDGAIIARAHNENRMLANPVMHAEIIAIQMACKFLDNERLTGCDLYVTKEPCAMCAGAIIHARIRNLIIATRDLKYGACGSVLTVCGDERLNHMPNIEFGLLEGEAGVLLSDFFKKLRRDSQKNPVDLK